jgi:hypothetical protein
MIRICSHGTVALLCAMATVAVLLHSENAAGLNAIVVDRVGVTSRVEQLVYEAAYLQQERGKAKDLYAWHGYAQVTIPWERIRRIDFVDAEMRDNAVVTTKDRQRVIVRLDPNTEYRGTNSFGGEFIIRSEHIRVLIFED